MKTENTSPFPSKQWVYVQGYTIAAASRILGVNLRRMNSFLEGKKQDDSLAAMLRTLPRRMFANTEKSRQHHVNMRNLFELSRGASTAGDILMEEYISHVYPETSGLEPRPYETLKDVSAFLLSQLKDLADMLKDMTPDNKDALCKIVDYIQALNDAEHHMDEYTALTRKPDEGLPQTYPPSAFSNEFTLPRQTADHPQPEHTKHRP